MRVPVEPPFDIATARDGSSPRAPVGAVWPGWATVASLLLVVAGCHARPRYTVERVVVERSPAVDSLEAAGLTAEALGRTASRLLDAAPGFVAARRAGAAAHRFLAQLGVQFADVRSSGAATGPAAHVVVTIALEPTGGGPALRETAEGFAVIRGGAEALPAALEGATSSAVESAVASLAVRLAAEQKAKSALLRDLASGNASVREHAMRVLAERGERDAVPALIAQLRDPDPEVRERAVGALAQLRDQRAVPGLIDLVRHRDPHYVAHMARIIGDLGGPDARGWLLTMAFGHPDQAVRTAAHDALADMTARELHASADQGRR